MNTPRELILLKAAYDLLKLQDDNPYTLNVLAETAVWDSAECDGGCLLSEIGELLQQKGLFKEIGYEEYEYVGSDPTFELAED